MAEREYLVSETYKVHGTTLVTATSKQAAIDKVRDAMMTDDAYEFHFEPGDVSSLRAERLR